MSRTLSIKSKLHGAQRIHTPVLTFAQLDKLLLSARRKLMTVAIQRAQMMTLIRLGELSDRRAQMFALMFVLWCVSNSQWSNNLS